MKNTKLNDKDRQILEILTEAAHANSEDQTAWVDTNLITLIVMDKFTRGSRQFVHRRLAALRRRGIVERRVFDNGIGWRKV